MEPWTDDLPPPDEFAWVYDLNGGNIEAGDRLMVRCSNGEYWASEPDDEEIIGWTEGTEFLAGNISGSSSDGQITLRDSQGRVLQYNEESETVRMRVGGPPAQIHFIDVQRTAARQTVYLQIASNPGLFVTGGRGVCTRKLSPIAAYTAPDVRRLALLDFNGGVLRNGDYLAVTCEEPTEIVFYVPNAQHEMEAVKAEVVQPGSIWRLLMSGDRVGLVQDDHYLDLAGGRLLRFWAQSGTAQMPPARYPFRIATALPPPPPSPPAPTPSTPKPQSPSVPTGPARLVGLDASASVVNAGQSFTLTFRLSQSAPPGGVTIGISSITTTGLTDALVVRPTSITIPGGQSAASTTIQTQRVTPDATRIVFTAQLNGPQVAVQIEIR